MPRYTFTQFLHDEWEESDYLSNQVGAQITDEERDRFGRPFYEVGVTVEIDTDTGEVLATHFQNRPITPPVKMK